MATTQHPAEGSHEDSRLRSSVNNTSGPHGRVHAPKRTRGLVQTHTQFRIVTGKPTKRARNQNRKGESRFKINIVGKSHQGSRVNERLLSRSNELIQEHVRNPHASDESLHFSVSEFASGGVGAVIFENASQNTMCLEAQSSPATLLDPFIESISEPLEEVIVENAGIYLPAQQTFVSDARGLLIPSSSSPWDATPLEDFHLTYSVPPSVLFGSINDKFHTVLAHYDRELCAIPLTVDVGLNPFRVRKETSSGSQFLLHAVLAHSLYHLTRQSDDNLGSSLLQRHRSTALHLFSRALGDSPSPQQKVAFLDTALLLMCLDSSQSASGVYNVHLEGVHTIIEAAGGSQELIPRMPKLRSQLAMFIWYDTTIAMISREAPTLPITYLEGIIHHGRLDGWDYFNLCGCRYEFIIAMHKLAKLAMQHEKAQGMDYLLFDTTGVDEIEQVLREWPSKVPIYDRSLPEEILELQRDRYHCEEAWRYAILLYIERVFRWERGKKGPSTLRYLSRLILDNTRSIRKGTAHSIQKQVLLPVFLAGAELQNSEYREFVREYCEWWTMSCGFKMFKDVYCYLQNIWEEIDSSSDSDFWWGTVIERKRREHPQLFSSQILMG
ncbi:fungal-specific transcription factor domain-containing protein [Tricladium varicosporioides]|nr:fungal-specific transcription factor domain-containing protein [Hymenoscyphus varicosporioides]